MRSTCFEARPAVGVGAGGYATARLRFRSDDLDVLHAHGYLVQTGADLGHRRARADARAARRVARRRRPHHRPWRGPDRRPASDAERIGLLTLGAVVVVFGVHSLVDWTWFIPGTVVPAAAVRGLGRRRADRPARRLHSPAAPRAPAAQRPHPYRVLAAVARRRPRADGRLVGHAPAGRRRPRRRGARRAGRRQRRSRPARSRCRPRTSTRCRSSRCSRSPRSRPPPGTRPRRAPRSSGRSASSPRTPSRLDPPRPVRLLGQGDAAAALAAIRPALYLDAALDRRAGDLPRRLPAGQRAEAGAEEGQEEGQGVERQGCRNAMKHAADLRVRHRHSVACP